jgi:hypothetical protein
MQALIPYNTLDLIDAIANSELVPIRHTPAGAAAPCVATRIAAGGSMAQLPRSRCNVEEVEGGYLVSWPHRVWTDEVAEYVAMIFDSSGVANATGD